MDSIPSELTVEDFEFKNKTLTIIGKTPGGTLTDSFVDRLDATGIFPCLYCADHPEQRRQHTVLYRLRACRAGRFLQCDKAASNKCWAAFVAARTECGHFRPTCTRSCPWVCIGLDGKLKPTQL
ncbi:MAG: hypothetical protein ACLSAP_05320 [Oscillospiraceae bacterium]